MAKGIDIEISELQLELWTPAHPRWFELVQIIEEEGQKDYVTFEAEFHRESYLLVALQDRQITGFLRAVVQPIGPDMGCLSLTFKSEVLREAKILAFAVRPPFQNQGIGRVLQAELIRLAKEWNCYQIRSHSDGHRKANHYLKMLMGFAVHPIVRGDDKEGVYFVMPLKEERSF